MNTSTQFANWLQTNGWKRNDDRFSYLKDGCDNLDGLLKLPPESERKWVDIWGYDYTIDQLFEMFEKETEPKIKIDKLLAETIFEKHWLKKTALPLDDVVKYHMQYAIDAIKEALETKVEK